MAPCLRRHLDPDPICPQDAERPGTHSIPRYYINTEVPVQVIVGLAQVKEDGMEDFLPHGEYYVYDSSDKKMMPMVEEVPLKLFKW